MQRLKVNQAFWFECFLNKKNLCTFCCDFQTGVLIKHSLFWIDFPWLVNELVDNTTWLIDPMKFFFKQGLILLKVKDHGIYFKHLTDSMELLFSNNFAKVKNHGRYLHILYFWWHSSKLPPLKCHVFFVWPLTSVSTIEIHAQKHTYIHTHRETRTNAHTHTNTHTYNKQPEEGQSWYFKHFD